MNDEFTNLLPLGRQRALVREYYIRLGVVGITLVTTLIFIAGVLLVPTYVFLSGSMSSKQTQLATIEARLSSSNESALSARLASLTADAAVLTELATTPSPSVMLREVLAVVHTGVALTGLSYTPANAKVPNGTIVVSGTAQTRDALRNYQVALQFAPFARVAALPVSAYAKDADINFSISITLEP